MHMTYVVMSDELSDEVSTVIDLLRDLELLRGFLRKLGLLCEILAKFSGHNKRGGGHIKRVLLIHNKEGKIRTLKKWP